MQVIKAVKQIYVPSEQTLNLLEDFRLMMNDCIRIGIRENATSMKALSLKCYHALSQYDVASCYRLTAISKAAGILRNYRKQLRKNPSTKTPYVRKMQLVDCYGFRIRGKRLRLTLRAHEYVYVDLNPHTLAVISGFTVRSVTLTNCTIVLSFSKETAVIRPTGVLGIDRNLDNVAISTTNGQDITYHHLSKATETKSKYRTVKSHLNRNDVRIRKQIYSKYGEKQRNKIGNILHNVSKQIVEKAKEEKLGIAMENIKGIRKLYRRGNGQGSKYRGRMNSWSYYELQRQIEYKAKWEGIPVVYVDAWGTSSKCSTCGSHLYPNEHRQPYCPRCNISVNRDVNAARNVRDRGRVRFALIEPPNEAMVQEPATTAAVVGNPESRWRQVASCTTDAIEPKVVRLTSFDTGSSQLTR